MTPLCLAIAGFGRLARDCYLPALATLPDVRLVAVADPLGESLAAAATRCPTARRFDSLATLLATERLDGLLVASPPSTHFAAWRAAVTAGVPAFVEKPLLLAHELALVEPDDQRAPLMVDFNRRFWPPYARARAALTAGGLGRPVSLDFHLHVDALGWSTVTRHRFAPEEGGLVHDLGSHAIDFTSWLLGETPQEITAVAPTTQRPDDHLLLTLLFPSGATARADLAYADRTRERLAARGPAGQLWQDEPNMALHIRRTGTSPRRLAARAVDWGLFGYRALRPSERVGRASIRHALEAFAAGIRAGGSFAPGVADGLWNTRCLAAAVSSAAGGGTPVRV